MERENIQSLAIAPLKDHAGPVGFVGVDSCSQVRSWDAEQLQVLQDYGQLILLVQTMVELATRVCVCTRDVLNWRLDFVAKRLQFLNLSVKRDLLWEAGGSLALQQKQLEDSCCLRRARNTLVQDTAELFNKKRYAVIHPDLWSSAGIDENDLAKFHELCCSTWHKMTPDVPPYDRFRDVGYARFRYESGSIFPLKHKLFFQVKSDANVIVGNLARPFVRVDPAIREHPVLIQMLQVLLEDVWGGELGPNVHVNVHPVRVRSFDSISGAIHNEMQTVLEGTHVDSVERVAVVLIEKSNIMSDMPKTALYDGSCAMGKRRDIPEDEKEIAPLRVTEVCLDGRFEAITFDDNFFKHDASNFLPENPLEPSWRSIMLIMCRRPVKEESFVDGHQVDGLSPRSTMVVGVDDVDSLDEFIE
eukprot:TRINITY_DN7110_c0_g1_i1.p1 TRINITY_DN7110_c0_g1~~TRINITY_DN7110_c0_g1_i1.p1  ORF type:complete len:416 (+),score=97.86 TRINITY_DN7110_c0_g1_i1:94-1341(+)